MDSFLYGGWRVVQEQHGVQAGLILEGADAGDLPETTIEKHTAQVQVLKPLHRDDMSGEFRGSG